MTRCPGCGYLRPDQTPYEPVTVIEVTSRDADGNPDGFREYTLPAASEAPGTAGDRQAGLGRPPAPGGVPAGMGDRQPASARAGAR